TCRMCRSSRMTPTSSAASSTGMPSWQWPAISSSPRARGSGPAAHRSLGYNSPVCGNSPALSSPACSSRVSSLGSGKPAAAKSAKGGGTQAPPPSKKQGPQRGPWLASWLAAPGSWERAPLSRCSAPLWRSGLWRQISGCVGCQGRQLLILPAFRRISQSDTDMSDPAGDPRLLDSQLAELLAEDRKGERLLAQLLAPGA